MTTADEGAQDDPVDEDAIETQAVSSTYKVIGDFADPDGAGVLGRNTASTGTPVGVEGTAPNAGEGYGLSTPDDARIEGDVDTTGDLAVTVDGDRALAVGSESLGNAGNVVVGHSSNGVSSGVSGATIGGGGFDDGSNVSPNDVLGDFGTISGGLDNMADGFNATVGGGKSNEATTNNATVAGGRDNAAGGLDATVGGGSANEAQADGTTVAGGSGNTATRQDATIGGGTSNTGGGLQSTIGGGQDNQTAASASTVGGGADNGATGSYATVGGGIQNVASAGRTAVGGGQGNAASSTFATVGGGRTNAVSAEYGSVGGGRSNSVAARYATIGGGGPWNPNDGSTQSNAVEDEYGTVGGGGGNVVETNGSFATIGGGRTNTASEYCATIGGGSANEASAHMATIPGGVQNVADGTASFATGRQADTNGQDGATVFADNSSTAVTADAGNQFVVQAGGGVKLYTDSDTSTDTGAELPAGSGSWTSLSARASKANVDPVNPTDALAGVCNLEVATWNYRTQDESVRHLGPMAEDFHDEFGLGEDSERISTVDADGVALAAIQGLAERLDEREERIDEHRETIEALQERVEAERERADDHEATIARQRREMDALEADLVDLSERVELLTDRLEHRFDGAETGV